MTASITETSYDLIVIGGGLAGLTAAVRAAELGLRPIVLEQGDGEDYPCNTRQSGGILHIAFHDPFRPAPELAGIIAKITRPSSASTGSNPTSRAIGGGGITPLPMARSSSMPLMCGAASTTRRGSSQVTVRARCGPLMSVGAFSTIQAWIGR